MPHRGDLKQIRDPDTGKVRLMSCMGWFQDKEEWEDVETGKILLLPRARRRELQL